MTEKGWVKRIKALPLCLPTGISQFPSFLMFLFFKENPSVIEKETVLRLLHKVPTRVMEITEHSSHNQIC